MPSYNPLRSHLLHIRNAALLSISYFIILQVDGPFKAAARFAGFVVVPILIIIVFWQKLQRRMAAITYWIEKIFR